ncbi:GGDEF domain-containing protein [Sciscionella sediminilitoris]|uniref:GGDEF domain-containing protein n=1 Tax=Sciscionella sediminilitoris TaxID=1445613 RepID=UPI0006923879|nr:GGDEF domain-containing protein [Sciscionella sp. SE31]
MTTPTSQAEPEEPGSTGISFDPRRWTCWQWPLAWRWYTAAAIAGVLVVTVLSALRAGQGSTNWAVFGIILVLGIAQGELSRGVERSRRSLSGQTHIDFLAIWVVPATLLLPVYLITVIFGVLYLHLWFRSWRPSKTAPLARIVSGACLGLLACSAAHLVSESLLAGQPIGEVSAERLGTAILVAAAVFELIDAVAMAISIKLRDREAHGFTALFGSADDNLLEATTLCLSVLAAFVLALFPFAAVIVLVPTATLHRTVLTKQLEKAASTDGKTGLANAAAWNMAAERTFALARRNQLQVGLLMIDLDFFKRVNDDYGHYAGDDVLGAVGTMLRTEVRTFDLAGRFGGEEFAVLLPAADLREAMAMAERIRVRVTELAVASENTAGEPVTIDSLTASVGVAMYPLHGQKVRDCLRVADQHVYAAKCQGRNRVVGFGHGEGSISAL